MVQSWVAPQSGRLLKIALVRRNEAGHFPYLLREVPVTVPNKVWAMDITYVPTARGFVYLAAVFDWFSGRVLAWRVSISMGTSFCIEAVGEPLARHGKPTIPNMDMAASSNR